MQLGKPRLASICLGSIVLAVAVTVPFTYRILAYEYLGTGTAGVFVVVRDEGDVAGYYAPDPDAESGFSVFKKRVRWLPGKVYLVTGTEPSSDPQWLYLPDREPEVLQNPFYGLGPPN